MAESRRGDPVGRVLGACVFLVGIAVIIVVLILAFKLFLDPTVVMRLPRGSRQEITFAMLAAGFVDMLVRILLLLVGSVSGALIATRGVRMYEAGRTTGPQETSETTRSTQ